MVRSRLLTRPIDQCSLTNHHAQSHYRSLCAGDWEAGKGIGLARVQVDANTVFDIYTTHTIAQYGNPDEYVGSKLHTVSLTRTHSLTRTQPHCRYFGHRVLEILEVVDFVRNTNKSPLLIVWCLPPVAPLFSSRY